MVRVLRKNNRVLVLERFDPKNKDHGLVDPRVFTGANNLHLLSDDKGMWSFKYDRGIPPAPLREKFTDPKSALNHATNYLKTKNIKIVEVLD